MNRPYTSALIAIALCHFNWPVYSQAMEYVAEGNHDRVNFNSSAGNPLALPPVGANYMRIISPTVLELVRITADTTDWNFVQNVGTGQNPVLQFNPPFT